MSIIRLFTRFAASAFLLSSPALMGEDIGTGTNGPSIEATEIQPSESGLEPWNVEWFGHFNAEIFEATGWIWHFEHGWVYPLESDWPYLNHHGWVWTNESIYPIVYHMHDQAWLWYFMGTSNPSEFYNFTTEEHEANP